MKLDMLHNTLENPNPKDLIGAHKVSLSCVPAVAILHEAFAMMEGAEKYGPFNWREHPVAARIYYDACLRHLSLWFEGEENDPKSGAHHLGHARACLGILLDAMTSGNLYDDRPIPNEAYSIELDGLNDVLTEAAVEHANEVEAALCTRDKPHDGPCNGWQTMECFQDVDTDPEVKPNLFTRLFGGGDKEVSHESSEGNS